ncbi:MAG: bifunctional folylpolyglutamate synthase/dihydrofolate synthase, partial [Puniceicoccales bacterium]
MPNIGEVQDYLYALRNRGAKLGIERMADFNKALDHPDRKFPIIHVAGTNGKGSVCAMLESIYRQAGLKTGLFTSPHLVHLGERIQVNRVPITDQQIVDWVAKLRPVAEQLATHDEADHPTFFEFMTAMAFEHFAMQNVEVGILETGLGGRLDSTNVITPEVSVITTIGLDHQEQLGNTLTEIAREKAGIIKPGKPVVIGRLPAEAESEVRRIATERGSAIHSIADAFGDDLSNYPESNLLGDHQRTNAATALLAARCASATLPFDAASARNALMQVDWAGRWQSLILADGRTLILEAAHNAEGGQALDGNLARHIAETGRKPVILCGTLGAYRASELMKVIARHAGEIHLLVPDQPRACT